MMKLFRVVEPPGEKWLANNPDIAPAPDVVASLTTFCLLTSPTPTEAVPRCAGFHRNVPFKASPECLNVSSPFQNE